MEQETCAAPALADFARQGAVYDGLIRTLREGSFVHAYLISGASGMGKRTLAARIAQFLVCTGHDKPCGVCPACVQLLTGNHPDVVTVQPGVPIHPKVEKGLKSIPVDEIRMVNELAGQHTFTGGRRVFIIQRADRMVPQAQNALLKTLEEPLADTVFLLTSDAPELLLTTIVSRCRVLKLHPWPDDVILNILKAHGVEDSRAREALHVSGGSIGQALAVAADESYWQRRLEVMRDFFALESRSDILRVSSAWKDRKDAAEELLNDIEDMLRSLLLVRLGQREPSLLTDYPQAWQRMAREGDLAAFSALLDAVRQARQLRANQVTWQAVVERLLLRLMEEKSKWST
ncbi:MAG: DNA polymerase III subunit delta' [Aristaeellaceae bacterium]